MTTDLQRDQRIPEPSRARREQMTDDEVLTVALRCGRPLFPSLYNELGRRGLHARFASLECSIVGREAHRLQ